MNGKSTYTIVPPSPRVRPVQDEWGLFDPNQAGLRAAFRAVQALNMPTVSEGAPEQSVHDQAPLELDQTPLEPSSSPRDEEIYELRVPEPVPQPTAQPRRAKTADRGAVYTLEFPTQCPQCCKEIGTVRVSRLLRTQVSFTSTLPRKGYIIVCPECDGILSAELSGLI